MKIKVSHGNLAGMFSMLPIRYRNFQIKKIAVNYHAAQNLWAHKLHMIEILKKNQDNPEMIRFNLRHRKNENQTRNTNSKEVFDTVFIQATGIISRRFDQRTEGRINLKSNFLLIEKKEYVDYA